MSFMPLALVPMWLLGLFSAALLGGGAFVVWEWYERELLGRGYLIAGVSMLGLALLGRLLVLLFHHVGREEPKAKRSGEVRRIRQADGRVLHTESYGPPDAQPIVLTHGWGLNSTEWYYARERLARRFRVIVWDLPGLGKSSKPPNNDYGLDTLARDLAAVLNLAGPKPAVLMGHSIGGMITLSLCRLFPESLGTTVASLVLVHTTYTNPVKTTTLSNVFRALQEPLLKPLMYVTVALAPLVWLLNWLSYLNGTMHLSTELQGFSGRETRGQLDFAALFMPLASPAVMARGMLAMFRFDETETLGKIQIPVLIVAGDRDPVLLPQASEYIDRSVKSAKLVTLSPAKHMGHMEQHDGFADLVVEFLGTPPVGT